MSRRDRGGSGCLGKIILIIIILGALGAFGSKVTSTSSSTTKSTSSSTNTYAYVSPSSSKSTPVKTATPTPEEKEKAALAEKEAYISSCEKVVYSAVERNPSQYKGKRIQVTGTVIQVIEGWFNYVTLRVNESGTSNTWYVSYKRSSDTEPRILENDRITLYGECTGVESYTSTLKKQITIPSMDAKYYK